MVASAIDWKLALRDVAHVRVLQQQHKRYGYVYSAYSAQYHISLLLENCSVQLDNLGRCLYAAGAEAARECRVYQMIHGTT